MSVKEDIKNRLKKAALKVAILSTIATGYSATANAQNAASSDNVKDKIENVSNNSKVRDIKDKGFDISYYLDEKTNIKFTHAPVFSSIEYDGNNLASKILSVKYKAKNNIYHIGGTSDCAFGSHSQEQTAKNLAQKKFSQIMIQNAVAQDIQKRIDNGYSPTQTELKFIDFNKTNLAKHNLSSNKDGIVKYTSPQEKAMLGQSKSR